MYYIFDIPVYRCNEAKYWQEYEKKKQQFLQHMDKENAPKSYERMEKWFEQEYWYPWKFNEIVGYLRLYVEGHHIKGNLHYVRAKRVVQGTNRRIFYHSKVFEYTTGFSDTSQKIYEGLLNALQKLRHPPLNRRYLDLDDFRRFGMYIDWRELIR